MEIFTPEAVLELLSTLVPLLSRPPFSSSTLEKVAWKYRSICTCTLEFSVNYCSLQLGSLCKGLVKVGGHLERTNSSALSRLQVVKWRAYWSMVFYWTAMLWGFCYHLIHIFSGSVDQFLPTPAWTLFWDCSCWRSAMLIWVTTLTSLLNWCIECSSVLSWQVIELRSLGWKPDPTVEKYYEERFVCIPSVVGCWACNKPIIVDLQSMYSRAFCSILTWTLVY